MIFTLISTILCFVFLGFDHFFRIIGNLGVSLLFKVLASACFVAYGIYSFINCKEKSDSFKKVSAFVLTGLCVGLVADFAIELSLYTGLVIFIVGHIFYLLAFSTYSRLSVKKVLLMLLFIAVIFVGDKFSPWFDFKGGFAVIMLYGAVWIVSLVTSFESFKWNTRQAKILPVGVLLFGISDMLLQFWLFPNASVSAEVASIMFIVSNVVYYAAQLILAYSISKDYIEC